MLGATAITAMLMAATAQPASADPISHGPGYSTLVTATNAAVADVMEDPDNPVVGMTVAVSRNGKLILNRGYGYADLENQEPMWRWMRSNIGSTSKALVTGPVAWQLITQQGIDPKTKRVYGTNGVLGTSYAGHQNTGNSRYNPIVSMAIGPNDQVYTWYSDRTMSIGTSTNLVAHQTRQPYTIPLGRQPKDIRAIDIAANGRVYVWYDDRTLSIGTPRNLGAYEVPQFDEDGKPTKEVSLPPGRSILHVVDMAIASNDRVYAWYDDGTVSAGTSIDLDAHLAPYPFSTSGSNTRYTIRGIGIAANDRVYAWYRSGQRTVGTSSDLDAHVGPTAYTVPSVPLAPNWITWYGEMTLQHLFDHSAGFVRSGDLAGAGHWFNKVEDLVTYDELHKYMLATRKPLFRPGTSTSYSNHGFGMWTLLVPKLAGGVSYRNYAINTYLTPLGLQGKVRDQDDNPDANMSRGYAFDADDSTFVQRSFSEAGQGLAAGGWTASAEPMLKITKHLMSTYGAQAVDDMGWGKATQGKLSHGGDTGGGSAFVAIFPQGYTSVGGKNLSNVHVAIAANTEVGSGTLDTLASAIALAVPDSNVPASYDLW